MRGRFKALSLLIPLVCVSGSCDPVTAAAVPILVITANWTVDGQPDRQFFFSSESDGLPQGTFTGEEDTGTQSWPLTGSWANGQIQFTVQRTDGNRLYVGNFTDRPNAFTVQSPQETVTLRKP